MNDLIYKEVIVKVLTVALFAIVFTLGISIAVYATVQCRYDGDSLLPGIASFVLPGAGQFMNGEDTKGFVHMTIAIGLPAIVDIARRTIRTVNYDMYVTLGYALGFAYVGWGLYSALDASGYCQKYCAIR